MKKLLTLLFLPIIFISSYSINADMFDSFSYYLTLPLRLVIPFPETRKVLHEKESRYFYIRVEEDSSGYRHLVFLPRVGSQSIYDPNNPDKIISGYIKYSFFALSQFKQKPENILFLGLGGGIMPMLYRKLFPDAEIEIVEIDDSLPEIAEEYFGFKPGKDMNIHISDARVFINRREKKYNLIVMDVYNESNIPFQVTTIEFFQNLKKCLSENGILYINLANLKNKRFIASEILTLFEVFPDTLIYLTPSKSNYCILSFANKISLSGFERRVKDFKPDTGLSELLKDRLTEPQINDVTKLSDIIITDDYAPFAD